MKTGVKKAVIPAAGLGTRFLPATKSIPKEMLTIVDKPILLYVIEEATRAGIEDIVLVAGRGKHAIEDFFDTSFELEAALEKSGRLDLLTTIRDIKNLANIISIRQKAPLGLGHAVYSARPVIGDEPFALLLGDEIMINAPGEKTATAQLCEVFQAEKKSAVAVMQVAASEVSKYGIIEYAKESGQRLAITGIVEKPSPEVAPSRMALPGRYVFSPGIFSFLQNAKPGKNGEIQLSDAMSLLAKAEGMVGVKVDSRRFDAGDKLGYLQANIELALERPELRESLTAYFKSLVARL